MAKKKPSTAPSATDQNGEAVPTADQLAPSETKSKTAKAKQGKRKKAKPKATQPENKKAQPKKTKTKQDKPKKLSKKVYKAELERLQRELVKLQYWVKEKGLKVVVLFEGRDAAGKGGTIQRISDCLNPRICRIVALGTPTEKEKSQWYFQRYVSQLPAGGEIALFDRSWYNRAGVERVMGFCTHQEYVEFMRSCPEFEHMLQRSGIILVKYWFSVSDAVQEDRFQDRLNDPTKRWKLSPMDLEARAKWVEYSKAKDDMFAATDTTRSPWHVVEADDKKRARLNCINHLLTQIDYGDLTPPPMKLPPRQENIDYERPPMSTQNFVPEKF
ncbi:polyphosphate kinase 2 [Leptolyngbya sp. BC1307]|uniref:polyphosphate kinase 2 n=1 Tax=Leptolyngbya sp. BC1307 TaxID=2029589 RepID=UPI000EFB97E5|nr:polyphosphate kinase 2 [Leptolyngbya sp. BC1307]